MSFSFNPPSTSSGTSTTPAPSLFGGNTSSSGGGGGIFGNIGGQTPQTGSKPLLGAAGGGSGSTPPIFGQGASTTPTFSLQQPAGQQQSTGNLFGSTPNKPAESSTGGQQKPGGLFGEVGKSNSPFGTTTPGPATGGLFGGLSTTPAGPPPATTAPSQPSFFGQPAQSTGTTPSLFGNKPSTPSTTESTTPAAPVTGGLFGAKGAAPPSFGSGTLFGNVGDKQAGSAQAGKEDGKPNLFGATPPTTQASAPMFSLSPEKSSPTISSAATSATTPGTTAPATGGLFGGLSTPKTSAPSDTTTPATTQATSTPLFSLGAKPTTDASSPATTATTSATTSAPTIAPLSATTAPPTTASGTTTAPATATTTTTTGATTLGVSTVGPAPPAQSRLKNKTMDEIITRWATDLTKYQKEFQEQAEQVADWDRMLVENATKVQKLYGNTVDAERATQEVERQLAAVEGQQDELSSWLDRYEQEVEALLSKQVGAGDSLQGPDQERERTYKLAERLSERLNDMGQDLTSMIEEVNSASANLSKTTKADEPISQIVRILNTHLSQLQLIDQGTATLRSKIAAAQKVGGSISGMHSQYGGYRSGTPGSASGGAAEDFYRVFMGRR